VFGLLRSKSRLGVLGVVAISTAAAMILAFAPSVAAAGASLSPATPNVVCCGGGGGGYPNATVGASAAPYSVDYGYISATSSGWHQGVDVYLYFYVEYPTGSYSPTYELDYCPSSGGTCDASTSWSAGKCPPSGTYRAFVYGYATQSGVGVQGSNTAEASWGIAVQCFASTPSQPSVPASVRGLSDA